MFNLRKSLGLMLILCAVASTNTVEAESTICAGNLPPEGMVITAAGTSEICPGACRTRVTEPAESLIMVICADQPVPSGYELESITSVPACSCIAEQDNAYVIRRTLTLVNSPYD